MKIAILIFLFFLTPFISAQESDYSGFYSGSFKHGKFSTDLAFNILSENDSYKITFNSLNQNAFGIPAGDITADSNAIKFALQSDFYRYDFELKQNQENNFTSTLKVDDKAFKFNLTKRLSASSYELNSMDIRFRSGALLLYGTIYYPETPNGKAIYLVTSSGSQDRSASRAEAILFAKEGFVSFHIDKRGTGISDGNWELATIQELCEDDLHALEYLHQIEKIQYQNIGIKGSSQGATKVPYILKKQPKLGFGIVVSCPGSTLLESDLNYWKNRNLDLIGASNIDKAAEVQGAVFQYLAMNISKETLDHKIEENQTQPWFKNIWIPNENQVQFDQKLNYSPLPYFKDLTAPLLVIQGSEDQIIPESSLKNIKKSIGSKRNKKTSFISLKGANHSMMLTKSSDFPYWSSLHPNYLNKIFNWIH